MKSRYCWIQFTYIVAILIIQDEIFQHGYLFAIRVFSRRWLVSRICLRWLVRRCKSYLNFPFKHILFSAVRFDEDLTSQISDLDFFLVAVYYFLEHGFTLEEKYLEKIRETMLKLVRTYTEAKSHAKFFCVEPRYLIAFFYFYQTAIIWRRGAVEVLNGKLVNGQEYIYILEQLIFIINYFGGGQNGLQNNGEYDVISDDYDVAHATIVGNWSLLMEDFERLYNQKNQEQLPIKSSRIRV